MAHPISGGGGATPSKKTDGAHAPTGKMGDHEVKVIRSPSLMSSFSSFFSRPSSAASTRSIEDRVSVSSGSSSPISVYALDRLSPAGKFVEFDVPYFVTSHGGVRPEELPVFAKSDAEFQAKQDNIFRGSGDTFKHNLSEFDIVTLKKQAPMSAMAAGGGASAAAGTAGPALLSKESAAKQVFRDLMLGSLMINGELITKEGLKPAGYPVGETFTFPEARDKLLAKLEEKLAGVGEPLKTRLYNCMHQGLAANSQSLAALVFNTSHSIEEPSGKDKALKMKPMVNPASVESINDITSGGLADVGSKMWRGDLAHGHTIHITQTGRVWKAEITFPILVKNPVTNTESRFELKTVIGNVADGSGYLEIKKV
jgi:hypothetical protein